MFQLPFFLLALALNVQETQPLTFEVKLPASASLEIDGYRTTSQGATREFRTPAVAVGPTYAYTLKVVDGGRVLTRTLHLTHANKAVVDFTAEFNVKPEPMHKGEPTPKKRPLTPGATRPGFVSYVVDGRLWVFKAGSKELAEFETDGPSDKHVTRIGGGPAGMTLKAPDGATIDAFMKAMQDKK